MLKKNLGKLGEKIAKKFLIVKGYKYLTSNFRSKLGEIDLIFLEDKTLVFIEVKTRSNLNYGNPANSINSKKLNSLIKTAQYFMLLNPQYPNSYRIDVITIILNPKTQKTSSVKHFKNITL